MRYIIIPLLIILYFYWSYKSIREIKDNNWKIVSPIVGKHSFMWYALHCIIIGVIILMYVGWFIVQYW